MGRVCQAAVFARRGGRAGNQRRRSKDNASSEDLVIAGVRICVASSQGGFGMTDYRLEYAVSSDYGPKARVPADDALLILRT
jgi:hypothetical protein